MYNLTPLEFANKYLNTPNGHRYIKSIKKDVPINVIQHFNFIESYIYHNIDYYILPMLVRDYWSTIARTLALLHRRRA
jgi:hypothetical protein